MIKKVVKEHYVFSMLLIGIIGSALFLMAGYSISGVLFSTANTEGNRVNYNQYTPIVMLLSFIIFEMLFYLLMVDLKNKPKEDKAVDISAIEIENKEDVLVKEMKNTISEDTEEDGTSISGDLFMDLNENYSIEQITEMMKISKYIGGIDASLLTKMFKPNMSAEEIQSYIEMFYE